MRCPVISIKNFNKLLEISRYRWDSRADRMSREQYGGASRYYLNDY